jgi:2-polyprenyl-3-methyl-5-hydroxy-6-metoxy-1,4-benzoquinol methylase
MQEDGLQQELDRFYAYGGDRFVRYTHRLRIDRMRELIEAAALRHRDHPRPRALDAGTGFGIYAILLAGQGYEVTAFDINPVEIERAREWGRERGVLERVGYRVGDILTWSEGAGTFDLAVCSEVLEHLDDPRAGAATLYRALRPGGLAIVTMPNMACVYGALQLAYRASGLRALMRRPPLNDHQIQHARYWFGNILPLLRGAGLSVDGWSSSAHLPFAWTVDGLLGRWLRSSRLVGSVDDAVARLPLAGRFGFNFIVLASKP